MGGAQAKSKVEPTKFNFYLEAIAKNLHEKDSSMLTAAIGGQINECLSKTVSSLKCAVVRNVEHVYTRKLISKHQVQFEFNVLAPKETRLSMLTRWSKHLEMEQLYSWIVPNDSVFDSNNDNLDKRLKSADIQFGYYKNANVFFSISDTS